MLSALQCVLSKAPSLRDISYALNMKWLYTHVFMQTVTNLSCRQHDLTADSTLLSTAKCVCVCVCNPLFLWISRLVLWSDVTVTHLIKLSDEQIENNEILIWAASTASSCKSSADVQNTKVCVLNPGISWAAAVLTDHVGLEKYQHRFQLSFVPNTIRFWNVIH